MKWNRKKWTSGVFLLGIILFLFTPIGFKIKVHLGRFLASSAAMLKTEMQTPLDTYQWRLSGSTGEIMNFEEVEGEVVLVNFWATWCPPCVAEMPSLQKLYNEYKNDVKFVFVAKDDIERVDGFLKKGNYDLPVFYSKTKTPKVLSSKVLPTTYIINRQGKIVVAETGAKDWNAIEVREILDALIEQKRIE